MKAFQNLCFFNINSFIPLKSDLDLCGMHTYSLIAATAMFCFSRFMSLFLQFLWSSLIILYLFNYYLHHHSSSCICVFPLLCFIFSHRCHASSSHTNGDSIPSDPTSLLRSDADIWYHRCWLPNIFLTFLSPGKLWLLFEKLSLSHYRKCILGGIPFFLSGFKSRLFWFNQFCTSPLDQNGHLT